MVTSMVLQKTSSDKSSKNSRILSLAPMFIGNFKNKKGYDDNENHIKHLRHRQKERFYL